MLGEESCEEDEDGSRLCIKRVLYPDSDYYQGDYEDAEVFDGTCYEIAVEEVCSWWVDCMLQKKGKNGEGSCWLILLQA